MSCCWRKDLLLFQFLVLDPNSELQDNFCTLEIVGRYTTKCCISNTHPDSADSLHRSHITQYRCGYCKFEYLLIVRGTQQLSIKGGAGLFLGQWVIPIKKETSPTLNRDGGMNFQKFMISFWKHRDQGHHLRQVSEKDQSVAIQLPSTEDSDGYHRNIWINNVSGVD